jgi:hypothetical protein
VLVEEQGGVVGVTGQSGRSSSQPVRARRSWGVDGDFPGSLAFAVDPQAAFAGGEADVVDSEGDNLADAGPA